MAILSTVKKVIPYIKEAAGYVLCHISSQAVEMDDGTLLQDKIESMDSEIDGKANTSHTHTATQITGLTASRAMVSDGSGHPAVSNVTATELNYLDGATSNIQNQINTLNSNLDEIEESVSVLNGKIISGSRLIEFTNGVGWIPFDANSTQKEPVFTANLVRIEVQTTEWISAVNASEYKKGRLVVYLNTKSTLERYVQYVCILQD